MYYNKHYKKYIAFYNLCKGVKPVYLQENKLNSIFRETRLKNRYKQKEFCELVGISRTHLANIEGNRERPSKSVVKLLALQFDLDEKYLLDLLENEDINYIHRIRLQNNLTQVEFAEMLCITESEVISLEKGTTKPSRSVIRLLSLQFGIDEKELTTEMLGGATDDTCN